MNENDAAPASEHKARQFPPRWTVSAVAAMALLVAAGCGGGHGAAPVNSLQRWHTCLRSHGMTIPSAGPGLGAGAPSSRPSGLPSPPRGKPPVGGHGSLGLSGLGSSARDRAAQAACRKYAPAFPTGGHLPSGRPSLSPGSMAGAGSGGTG